MNILNASTRTPEKSFFSDLEEALCSKDYNKIVELLNAAQEPIPEHNMFEIFQYSIRSRHNDLFLTWFPKFQCTFEFEDCSMSSVFATTAINSQNTEIFEYFLNNNMIDDAEGYLLHAAVEIGDVNIVEKLLPYTDAQAQKSLAFRKALNFNFQYIFDLLLPLSDVSASGYNVFNIVYRKKDERNCKKLLDVCDAQEVLSFLTFDGREDERAFVERVFIQKQKDLLNEELVGIVPSGGDRKRKM